MSAQSFTEFPFNMRDFSTENCFYCGKLFDTTTTFVQWRGHVLEVNLHVDCAKELAIHLASDHLKALYHPARNRQQS